MLKSAAVLVALLAAASPADAKCIQLTQMPRLLVKNAGVPFDGALVVAQDSVASGDKLPALTPTTWKLAAGRKTFAPVVEVLAPGLARYTLPGKVGTAKVMQGKNVVGSLTLTQQVPQKLAAPAVTGLVYTSRTGRMASERLEVKLAAPLPDGALAIVIADKAGTGRSFELLRKGETTVYGLERGRCDSSPEGTVSSIPGDEVVVYYLDRHGRRSPSTSPIKVTGTVGDPSAEP